MIINNVDFFMTKFVENGGKYILLKINYNSNTIDIKQSIEKQRKRTNGSKGMFKTDKLIRN